MEFTPNDPPREFVVGSERITIRDCGRLRLDANEQVTFTTQDGCEYDVARKSWGFYATPSTNGRLRDHQLRTALVLNSAGRLYVMLVQVGHEERFAAYLAQDQQRVLMWLDDDADVQRLAAFADAEQTQDAGGLS